MLANTFFQCYSCFAKSIVFLNSLSNCLFPLSLSGRSLFCHWSIPIIGGVFFFLQLCHHKCLPLFNLMALLTCLSFCWPVPLCSFIIFCSISWGRCSRLAHSPLRCLESILLLLCFTCHSWLFSYLPFGATGCSGRKCLSRCFITDNHFSSQLVSSRCVFLSIDFPLSIYQPSFSFISLPVS